MISSEMKELIIKALKNHSTEDSLNRAKQAFSNCSFSEMNSEYGQSGQTRQEIINGYQTQVDKCNNAIQFIKSLPLNKE